MAIASFFAGRYSSTYTAPAGAALDMGITEDGIKLSVAHEKEAIDRSDAYGAMLVDSVYQGISRCQLELTALEYKTGLLTAVLPYNAMAASGNTTLSPGVIGRLDSAVAGGIVLTSTTSTPAVSAPATLTATYAIISRGFDINWVYSSKLRRIPARWDVLAYLDTTVKFLVAT